jgi:23S rRNA (uridine2552-2'-O)-methyltransferase
MPERGGKAHRGRLAVRVKSARGRKASSTRWLQRQLNDPFVAEAARLGLRSRAAFKLIEIDDRFRLLKPGKKVVDLGAAPGGWTQVAAGRVRASAGSGRVAAVDISPMEPVAGVTLLQRDFLAPGSGAAIEAALGGAPDVVLSDMAGNTTGHHETDQLRSLGLCEAAHDFARGLLAPGGAFVAKMIQGGGEAAFEAALKRDFAGVKRVKPKASRADSAEVYFVATGFRGRGE